MKDLVTAIILMLVYLFVIACIVLALSIVAQFIIWVWS